MGLLRLSGFSSIPNLFKKIQSRREQKEKYVPTWKEFASTNFTQVLARDGASNGTTILFTVPDNLNLFITNVWMHSGITTGEQIQSVHLLGDSTLNVLMELRTDGINSANNSMNFSMPVRVEADVVVNYTASGIGNFGTAGFTGFTTPKSEEIV